VQGRSQNTGNVVKLKTDTQYSIRRRTSGDDHFQSKDVTFENNNKSIR
jgi:hypothetical protein